MTRRSVTISVTVPGLLARYTDDQRVVAIAVDAETEAEAAADAKTAAETEPAPVAATVGETIGALLDRYPPLRPHLFTDGGAPREHLVFLADGTAVDPVEEADTELAAGGSVVIVQAVSGG